VDFQWISCGFLVDFLWISGGHFSLSPVALFFSLLNLVDTGKEDKKVGGWTKVEELKTLEGASLEGAK